MPLQNMPRVFLCLIQLEGKEQGPGLEVAELENEQNAIRQVVVRIGQSAFFGRKAEEMYAFVVIELWPSVQLLDLLIFQNLEPVFVPVDHGRLISPA